MSVLLATLSKETGTQKISSKRQLTIKDAFVWVLLENGEYDERDEFDGVVRVRPRPKVWILHNAGRMV